MSMQSAANFDAEPNFAPFTLARDLIENEVGYLRSLIRMEYRRQLKKKARFVKRFGDEAELESTLTKIAMLREMYAVFGGDPDNITTSGGV